jgi:nitric oxide reductase NorQ protein
MAKLALPRLLDRPSEVVDERTRSSVGLAGDMVVDVFSPANLVTPAATFVVTPTDVSVAVGVLTDSFVAPRINRLLDGVAGAPRIEKYHRTGRMVARFRGHPRPLPVSFTLPLVPMGAPGSMGVAPTIVQAVAPAPVPPAPAPAPAPEAPAPMVLQPESPHVALKVAPAAVDAQTCGCPAGGCLFTYPDRSRAGRIITSALTKAALKAALAKHRSGERSTVALVGPKGTGKTELVWDLAAAEGMGLFVFDGAGASSFADWTGATALVTEGGQTVTRYIPSSFIEAIRVDGPHGDEKRLVLVDELNRAELAGALNALMPILSAGSLYIPETGRTVVVSRNVMFLFTLNRGSAYNATITLDAALSDRIETWVRTEYLPEQDETNLVCARTGLAPEQAARLVRVGRHIRDVAERGEIDDGVSTRRILVAGSMVSQGMSLRDAAEVCWANIYPDEGGSEGQRGLVITAINAALSAS